VSNLHQLAQQVGGVRYSVNQLINSALATDSTNTVPTTGGPVMFADALRGSGTGQPLLLDAGVNVSHGVGQVLPSWKTANLGRTATTRSSDPDLQVTLDASATYQLHAYLDWWCATAGTGMNMGFTYPAGAAGRWGGAVNLAGSGFTNISGALTDAFVFATPASVNQGFTLSGTVFSGSGGLFTVSWAPQNATGPLNLNAWSNMVLRRIG
jgi:hypothetical protein